MSLEVNRTMKLKNKKVLLIALAAVVLFAAVAAYALDLFNIRSGDFIVFDAGKNLA